MAFESGKNIGVEVVFGSAITAHVQLYKSRAGRLRNLILGSPCTKTCGKILLFGVTSEKEEILLRFWETSAWNLKG